MIEKCHILIVNPQLTLESVKELLELDYTFIPKVFEGNDYPNESQYRNENKWLEISEISEIYNTRYFEAQAQMEISKGGAFYADGTIKPKDQRVNRINTSVIFLEIKISENKNFICLLVEGSATLLQNLKKNLLGGRNGAKELKEKWNIIKDPSYFKFSSDFFIWILLKKELQISYDVDTPLFIKDINFIDDIHESHNRKHQTDGDNVLNDILANLALFLDPKLLSLGLVISSEQGHFDFRLSADGSIYLIDKTYLFDDDREPIPIDDETKKNVYIYVYGTLLNKLLLVFYKEIGELGWLTTKKDIFLKNQGLNSFFKLAKYLGFSDDKPLEKNNSEHDSQEKKIRDSILLLSKNIIKKFDFDKNELFEEEN